MAEDSIFDTVIVGGGLAGLTAALYLARARCRVLVVEKDEFGGQINITDSVVNYPGVFSASGRELTDTMRRQAEAFGAEFLLAEVSSLELDGDVKRVVTSRGSFEALTVLLATGAHPRTVGFAGEERFRGHGVEYCATCDGEFFSGREVFVVGGGFAAAEESVFLTKYASYVAVLVREDDFTCAPATAEATKANPKIDVLYGCEVVEVKGDSAVRSIRWRNRATGEEHEFADPAGIGVFVFVGYAPATDPVRGIADLDGQGYVLTDDHKRTSTAGSLNLNLNLPQSGWQSGSRLDTIGGTRNWRQTMGRPSPKYTAEFKQRALEPYRSADGATFASIGREIGVDPSSVANWVRRAEGATTHAGDPFRMDEEPRMLRKESARPREENEILLKASAFFASRGL